MSAISTGIPFRIPTFYIIDLRDRGLIRTIDRSIDSIHFVVTSETGMTLFPGLDLGQHAMFDIVGWDNNRLDDPAPTGVSDVRMRAMRDEALRPYRIRVSWGEGLEATAFEITIGRAYFQRGMDMGAIVRDGRAFRVVTSFTLANQALWGRPIVEGSVIEILSDPAPSGPVPTISLQQQLNSMISTARTVGLTERQLQLLRVLVERPDRVYVGGWERAEDTMTFEDSYVAFQADPSVLQTATIRGSQSITTAMGQPVPGAGNPVCLKTDRLSSGRSAYA